MLLDEDAQLSAELGLFVGIWHSAVSGHARHILNHSKTHFVAGAVEKIWLYFDLVMLSVGVGQRRERQTHMLANSIETETLEHLQIVHHRFAIRRKIQAIRPESLIQSAYQEGKFTIEQRSFDAIDVANRNTAECGVAADGIAVHGNSNVVQVR